MGFAQHGPSGSHGPGRHQGRLRRVVASLAAVATLAAGGAVAATAMAGGGSGNAGGGPAGGSGNFNLNWTYKDGPAFGTTDEDVRNAIRAVTPNIKFAESGNQALSEARQKAMNECQQAFDAAHPGEGNAGCRIVGVGWVEGTTTGTPYLIGATASREYWSKYWYQYIAGSKDSRNPYSYNGVTYTTYDQFEDQPGVTVNSLAEKVFGDVGHGTIAIIALNRYQPKPPLLRPDRVDHAAGAVRAEGRRHRRDP